MRLIVLASLVMFIGCSPKGAIPSEPHERGTDYLYSDEEAGYDQAAYDQCRDTPDTTEEECDAIVERGI